MPTLVSFLVREEKEITRDPMPSGAKVGQAPKLLDWKRLKEALKIDSQDLSKILC
jgi:hypothetical protein